MSGKWRFKLDPKNEGIEQEWFRNRLRDKIQLPGSLQEQGYGYDVDVNTKWTGQIVDQSWFTAPEYAKYREKGNVKVPFWLNPEIKDFYKFTTDDFKLENYVTGPQIKNIPVAV